MIRIKKVVYDSKTVFESRIETVQSMPLALFVQIKVVDIPLSRMKDIVLGAQELWAQVYGHVRASGLANRERRVDYGSTKKKHVDSMVDSGSKPSIAGWLRKRKLEVFHATGANVGSTSIGGDSIAYDVGAWGEGHDKEMAFLQDRGSLKDYVVLNSSDNV